MVSNARHLVTSFLTVSALLFLAGTLVAQDTAKETMVDPTGTWRWSSDNQSGETVEHELAIKASKDGKVTAIYNGMLDDLKSAGGWIKGNKLMIDFEVETPERDFEAKYEATIKGNEADGTITLSSTEGSMELPWNAKRALELTNLVGKWDMLLEAPDQDHEVLLSIMQKGKKITGMMEGENIGKCEVTDMKMKDGVFTFNVEGQVGGSDFEAEFEAKASANKLKGETSVSLAGETHEFPVSAKKQPESGLQQLVGTWNMLLETPDEDHEPRLIVTEKDGKVSAVFDAREVGEFDAKNLKLDKDKLSFTVEGDLDGNEFEALCVVKVDGGKFKGDMMMEIGGQEMEFPLSGKLAK